MIIKWTLIFFYAMVLQIPFQLKRLNFFLDRFSKHQTKNLLFYTYTSITTIRIFKENFNNPESTRPKISFFIHIIWDLKICFFCFFFFSYIPSCSGPGPALWLVCISHNLITLTRIIKVLVIVSYLFFGWLNITSRNF